MDQETANFQQVKRFFEKLQESLAVQYMAHFLAYEASAEHGTEHLCESVGLLQ